MEMSVEKTGSACPGYFLKDPSAVGENELGCNSLFKENQRENLF